MSGNDRSEGEPLPGGERTLAELTSGDVSNSLSVLGHFYRAEVERMVGWRQRLDQTTNWSVVLMAAILTFVFSSEGNPHYVLLVAAIAVGAFLLIEAHRYREYDAWRFRVRLLQRYFIADVTDPDRRSEMDWRAQLGQNLRDPTMTISRLRAIAHRLQHVYLLLISVLLAAWALRITVYDADAPWTETAAISVIPGYLVVGVVGAIYLFMLALVFWSATQARSREFEEEPASKKER